MASISHLAAGALCGAVYARRTNANAGVCVAAFAALAAAPDLDFIALEMGSDGTPLEHRVMTHSLPFALVVGVGVGAVLAGALKGEVRRWTAMLLSVLALASHGVLDAMTSNGPGPQLFWPFSATPIQFPWQPIPGTRFYQEYFTTAAFPVMGIEVLFSLPLVAAACWVLLRGARPPRQPVEAGDPLLTGRALPSNE